MSRFYEVLSSATLRHRVEQACRILEVELHHGTLCRLASDLAHDSGDRALVVHDFQPEPQVSFRWLDEAVGASPAGTTVFGLLDSPASRRLGLLLRTPHRFALTGVAVADEIDAPALASELREAFEYGTRMGLRDRIGRCWRLDPTLDRLVEFELAMSKPHATLQGLLREARVGRKRFVKRAKQAGFNPPLRFFRSLRLVQATALLQESLALREVVTLLAYRSARTVARHYRDSLGVTLRQARQLPLDEAIRRLAPTIALSAQPDGT
jgi:AraC-like DNA-binding protein